MDEELAALFRQVRDIPYRIALTPEEPDCSCSGKNGKLKALLEARGVPVRWRVCTFTWSSIPTLPPEVTKIPHSDTCTHAYLEVERGGAWQPVDATWDAPLARILPVAEWDGVSATPLAVTPTATYSPEESARLVTSETREVIEADLKINSAFYAAFNEWLARERAGATSRG